MTSFSFNKGLATEGKVSSPTNVVLDNIDDYANKGKNVADELKENTEDINLNEFLEFEKKIEETEDTVETIGQFLANCGATLAVGATSILSGVLDVGESLLDGLVWCGATVASWLGIDTTGAKEFIARDLVTELNEYVYEETSIGQAINDASYLKYDSETALGIRSVSEKATVFVAATAATVLTGGAAAPLVAGGLGFAYGAGSAAENTYATKGTDTTVIDELLIFANGGISAISWAATGKLGQGFLEIGKAMSEASVKEILAQMAKEIFSKDMLKELLKPGNIVGNAIGTLMQTGGDIALIATKIYNNQEVTPEEWALLVGELIVYFGLNVVEDALSTEISGFKAQDNSLELSNPNDRIDTDEVNASPKNNDAKKSNELEDTLELDPSELEDTLELDPSELEKTLELDPIRIEDLDDSVGEELLAFSRRMFIHNNYFYTDEGRKILEIYNKLSNISYAEFNARFPGVFSYEDAFLDALDSIASTKNRLIMKMIVSEQENITLEQFTDIQDFLLNRYSFSNMNIEDFAYLRRQIEAGGFSLDKRYQSIYEQLCKKMDLAGVEEEITQRLLQFSGGYVTHEKAQSILGSFRLEVDSDFSRNASNSRCAGYNDGHQSVINLRYTSAEIEDIMSHESVHQISHNNEIHFDAETGARISLSGVSRQTFYDGSWHKIRTGINESITEYFHQISHGEGYERAFLSGYQPGVDALESFVDSGIISVDDLKKYYFTNDGEGLIRYFDDIADRYNLSMRGEDIARAFDQAALSELGETNQGVKTLNIYLKNYQQAFAAANSPAPTGLLGRIKALFGKK